MSGEIASKITQRALDYYYEEIYDKYLYGSNLQSCGSSYFLNNVIANLDYSESTKHVLEVGAGKGELLSKIRKFSFNSYTCIDKRLPQNYAYEDILNYSKVDICHVQGDVENMQFLDSQFDLTVSTCLFHHLSNPIAAILELWRVTKTGGKMVIGMPTDPHILNQIVKRTVSYRSMRRISRIAPEMIYALEHPNHARALITYFEVLLGKKQVEKKFYPFRLKSLDFNLQVVLICTVDKSLGLNLEFQEPIHSGSIN
jgi:ubiquinone/menaquinone biosynthesis C-methylase UbiE